MDNVDIFLSKYDYNLGSIPSDSIHIFLEGHDDRENYKLISLLRDKKYLFHIKNFDLRINCLFDIVLNGEKNDITYDLYSILKCCSDDAIKMKYYDLLIDDFYKTSILVSLKDEQAKIDKLNTICVNYYKIKVLDSIKNDALLVEYYKNCHSDLKIDVVIDINDDIIKEKLLQNFPISRQVRIIKTFKSEALREKYAAMKEFAPYRLELISCLNNQEFIINYFKSEQNISNQLKLMGKISDIGLREKLVDTLENSMYKKAIKTNNPIVKKNLLKKIDLKNINYNIDPSITIGVELEACNDKAKPLMLIKRILGEWEIKRDSSVNLGLEITSPVLHFNKDSLKELYYICGFMNYYGFFTNETCGGHIHLGFDYIKSIEEFKVLINLYGNTENILYAISNRTGSKCRKEANTYAKEIDKKLKKISSLKADFDKIEQLSDYATLMKEKQGTRYYGINLQNIGSPIKNTIEFRIPNGEINFNELINNIRLFAKILEKAKLIANTDDKELLHKYRKLVKCNLLEQAKFYILLDILFDTEEEKQVYIGRYNKNESKIKRYIIKRPIEI